MKHLSKSARGFLDRRRQALSRHPSQTGIDFVTVEGDATDSHRLHLRLHFVSGAAGKQVVPSGVAASNLRFYQNAAELDAVFEVEKVERQDPAEPVLTITVRLGGIGDQARHADEAPIYTLELLDVPGLDPFFCRVHFSLDVTRPPEWDCTPEETAAGTPAAGTPAAGESGAPAIGYLARDYATFRRLMLERLGGLMPEWQERSPADQLVAVVEVLADAADRLSYYQDAVATDAYLDTARQRISVRRHARLVGYRVSEGTNARTWVHFQVGADTALQPGQGSLTSAEHAAVTGTATAFITELKLGDSITAAGQTRRVAAIASDTELEVDEPFAPALAGADFIRPGVQLLTRVERQPRIVLQPGSDRLEEALAQDPVIFETLHPAALLREHNELPFYGWGAPEFTLPRGATRAVLAGRFPRLRAGEVLILEEVKDAGTGEAEDAHPDHRHAVRLRRVRELEDPLATGGGVELTELEWGVEDALPFDLPVTTTIDDREVTAMSVALGNVVLADHGRTVGTGVATAPEAEIVATGGRFRPRLSRPGLTHREPYDHRRAREQPARRAVRQVRAEARPVLDLRDGEKAWNLRRDLLASDRFASDFVVEIDNHRRPVLRFGDGVLGKPPAAGTVFATTYRVGQGTAGNIGHDALYHVVTAAAGVAAVRNPLGGHGGTDPETLDGIRLAAPGTLRRLEQRTPEEEFARLAGSHPEVARAVAGLHWTGSWHRLRVAVERRGGRPVDDALKEQLANLLEDHRLTGWELEIVALTYVGLEIVLTVHVHPHRARGAVERDLTAAFGNRDLPGGRRGFFHPENFRVGQPIYLSPIVDAAVKVAGVVAVDTDDGPTRPHRFRRYGEPARGELAAGELRRRSTEIPRCDNDPARPENGSIRFILEGGR